MVCGRLLCLHYCRDLKSAASADWATSSDPEDLCTRGKIPGRTTNGQQAAVGPRGGEGEIGGAAGATLVGAEVSC